MDCTNCAPFHACNTGLCASKEKTTEFIDATSCPTFEDKDLVIKLPCKLGSPIYTIVRVTPASGIPHFSYIKKTKLSYTNLKRVLKVFGKTIFASKEQAESMFKKLTEKQTCTP